MQVRDVMTEATVTESPQDSLRSAAERMWRQQTGSLLITDSGHLLGIITERTRAQYDRFRLFEAASPFGRPSPPKAEFYEN